MSDRRDNANAPALATNGEERASAEQHPAEHDYNPLQSPYAPKKEPGQPTIKENFARSGDATHGSSEGVRDFIERRDGNFNHDVTSGQRELERLAASVRSVQRVEVAARLPRAAQLPSVLGLGPVGDGISPPRSLEPDYLPRRDALRGPRTMIKAIFLIMGIFTVPIAYYFWMGGWDTIPGAPAPDLASFNSKPIIPPRKPSGEAEATTARGGDPGTPAKVGPRTAKSSAGETAAMLQPDTPGAQDPHSSTAAYALDRPKPSSQEELDVAQEDDPRTPAKGEPPTAKSSTAAMLQPATPPSSGSALEHGHPRA